MKTSDKSKRQQKCRLYVQPMWIFSNHDDFIYSDNVIIQVRPSVEKGTNLEYMAHAALGYENHFEFYVGAHKVTLEDGLPALYESKGNGPFLFRFESDGGVELSFAGYIEPTSATFLHPKYPHIYTIKSVMPTTSISRGDFLKFWYVNQNPEEVIPLEIEDFE